jgi:hypothetical protein
MFISGFGPYPFEWDEWRGVVEDYTLMHKDVRRWLANLEDRLRMKHDHGYRAKHYARKRIRNYIKAIGQTKGPSQSVSKVIGCSGRELKQYLEQRFKPGMTWANHGKVWHIDHIMPVSRFDLAKRKDFLKACHFTNLQPLFAADNMRKGNKIMQQLHFGSLVI